MIAIAGAKGGCGKTTVTLGLAEALGRAGSPALAVDADRQLPNLHLIAGVDREPTVAALAEADSLASVAQRSPRCDQAGIVTAPKPAEEIDFEAALDPLNRDDLDVLIDCPSGAGPDVVDALTAADAVLVVTTTADRSVAAVETTIDVARRLELPVIGTLYNRCDTVPRPLEARLGVPTLGAIPEDPDPLESDSTRTAFDEAASGLNRDERGEFTASSSDGTRLETGIAPLDRALEGGVPPGGVVAVLADPVSQVEHLLYRMTTTRGTLYLTTERSARNVGRAIDVSANEYATPTIRHLDSDDPISQATSLIEKLPLRANLILDDVDVLEHTSGGSYVEFLNALKDRTAEINGLAVLHCTTDRSASRNRRSTMRAADAIFEFHSPSPRLDGHSPHSLAITKNRFDPAGTMRVELDVPLVDESAIEEPPTLFE